MIAIFATLLYISLPAPASCQGAPPPDVRQVIEHGLVDPSSAQYRHVRNAVWINRNSGQLQRGICGELNARNRMGGYSGFRRFVFAYSADGGVGFAWIDGESDYITRVFPEIWSYSCQ
jgi:hypothetical protein